MRWVGTTALVLGALCIFSCATERRSISRDEILKALARDDDAPSIRPALVSPGSLRVVLPLDKTPGDKRTALGRVRIATREGSIAEVLDFEPRTPAGLFHRCSALVLLEREEEALSSCKRLLREGSPQQRLAAVELLRRAMSESKNAEAVLRDFRAESLGACTERPAFEVCELASRASSALSVTRTFGERAQYLLTPGRSLFRVRARESASLWVAGKEFRRFPLRVDNTETVEVILAVQDVPLEIQWRSPDSALNVEHFGGRLGERPAEGKGAEGVVARIELTLREPSAIAPKVPRTLAGLDAHLTEVLSQKHPSVQARDALMVRFGDAPQVLSLLAQSEDRRLERVYAQQDQVRFAAALSKKMPTLTWPKAILFAPQGALSRLSFFEDAPLPRRHWKRQTLEAALDLERSDLVQTLYRELQQDATLADASLLRRCEEFLFIAPAPERPASAPDFESMGDEEAETQFLRDPDAFVQRLKETSSSELRFHQWRVRSAVDKSEALQAALSVFPLNATFLEISKQSGASLSGYPGDALFACQEAAAPASVQGGETRLLLDDERVFITSSQRVVYQHQQIYIGDRQAAEEYGELATDLDTWRLRFRKYRAGGTERGQPLTPESFALSQLDIGDIVEVCTLSFGVPANNAREVLEFSELPTANGQRTLAVHDTMVLGAEPLAMSADVGRARKGDFEIWHVERKLAARPAEYFTASAGKDEGVPALLFRTPLARIDGPPDPWLKRVSVAAIGEAKGVDAARALSQMVLQTIEHDPAQTEVMLTLSSGRGHRGLLLYSLAKAASLPVELFALHRNERFYAPTLYEDEWAMRFGFFLDELWVLPGATPSVGEIPRRFVGSQRYRNEEHVFSSPRGRERGAEVLTENEVERTPVRVDLDLSWVAADTQQEKWKTKRVEALGHWEGTLTWSLPPGNAAALRNGLLASNPAQRTTALVGAVKTLLVDAQIEDVAFTGLASTGEALGVGVRLHVPAGAVFDEVNFDGSELGALVSPTLLVAQSSRTHALWLPSFKSVFTMNLERPPEGSFVSLPSSTSMRLPGVEISLNSSASDEGLTLRRELNFGAGQIERSDYPSWRRRLLQILDESAIRFEVLLPPTRAPVDGSTAPGAP